MWLTAEAALAKLGVKPQTLYASVSRGRIRAKPDPADPRRSLYSSADVERLSRRGAGRRPTEAVAAEAIRWGDPVLESAVSTIAGGRLFYRGRDAVLLAGSEGFESVARLLWQSGDAPDLRSDVKENEEDVTALGAVFRALAIRASVDIPSYGRSAATLRAEAASVLATIAGAVCGPGQGPLHMRLASRWQRPAAAGVLRRGLVLLADHELNASTFAARVAVSTGAALSAGALAGLAALSGPLHGSAAMSVLALAARARQAGAEAAVRERLAEGRPVPAAGHPLYPGGDVRAASLLDAFDLPPLYADLAEAVERLVGEAPNVDFALAAMVDAFGLPETAPIQLFALSRGAGWLAHMLEQAEMATLIRPRARYVGVAPRVA